MKSTSCNLISRTLAIFTMLTVLLGSQPSLPARADTLLQPLLANGDFIWAKAFAGSDHTYNVGVATDAAGSVYMAGTFKGTVDLDPGPGTLNFVSAGDYDIYVTKLDASGALLWAKTLGGTAQDQAYGIALDSGGNVLTTGFFNGTADFDPGPSTYTLNANGINKEVFVSKLDANGNFVWASAMGGPGDDVGEHIATDALGNVYTTGSFNDTADFDPGAGTYNLILTLGGGSFISKLSSAGAFAWARALQGTGYVSTSSILVDSNYHVYTTGLFQGDADFDPGAGTFSLSASNMSGFISHLNADGSFAHADSLAGSGFTAGNDLALNPDGSLYVAGYFSSLLDLGSSHLNSAGMYDTFITKTDGNGNFTWAKSVGGTGQDFVQDLAAGAGGDVYATGKFAGTADFDPGLINTNTISAGLDDIFVLRFDQNGNYVWVKAMGGVSNDTGQGIALSPSGDVYTAGLFTGTADFDPSIGVYELSGGPTVLTAFTSKLSNDDIPPVVTSIVRANGNPTTAATVDFTVTFSEPVTGVDTLGPLFDDFMLTTDQYITNASVQNVAGSGSTYTVTVKTGQGSGNLSLDVIASGFIADLSGHPLASGFTSGEAYIINKVPTFVDVPFSYWASSYIERLYGAGITSGCSVVPSNFCPLTTVTRAQMAVFLVRGVHGVGFTPPAAIGIFSDVPVGSFGANYIEQLSADGITSGCGGGKFCPNQIVTRSQLAIFLVRAKHGVAFVPATALGVFTDVPVGSFGADYIEQLVKDGITSGCTPTTYCTSTTVKRDSMSVLLVRTFNLP